MVDLRFTEIYVEEQVAGVKDDCDCEIDYYGSNGSAFCSSNCQYYDSHQSYKQAGEGCTNSEL